MATIDWNAEDKLFAVQYFSDEIYVRRTESLESFGGITIQSSRWIAVNIP